MKNNVFKVVLLQALLASGKSEVRNFMAHVEPGGCRRNSISVKTFSWTTFPMSI